MVAPLVLTTLSPDPIPVTGTDGKIHVAYEIEVLNSGPKPAMITQIETLAGGPDGATVATVGPQEIAANAILIPNLHPARHRNPAGRTAAPVLDDVYDTSAEVPAEVTHRVGMTLGPALPENQPVSSRYPDAVTQIGGVVRTNTGSPVVIGPPLAGDDWVALNGCCGVTSHRGAVMGAGSRLDGSERYAIDWVRLDPMSVPRARPPPSPVTESATRTTSPSTPRCLRWPTGR